MRKSQEALDRFCKFYDFTDLQKEALHNVLSLSFTEGQLEMLRLQGVK
jgi:hypothetical protein